MMSFSVDVEEGSKPSLFATREPICFATNTTESSTVHKVSSKGNYIIVAVATTAGCLISAMVVIGLLIIYYNRKLKSRKCHYSKLFTIQVRTRQIRTSNL